MIVLVVCLPYTLYSMRIVTQGWDGQSLPPLDFLTLALTIALVALMAFTTWPPIRSFITAL